MPRSGAVMDWTGVTFVYGAGPTTVTIGEVEELQWTDSGNLKEFHGDAAPGPTHSKLTNRVVEVTVKSADVGRLASVPLGTEGTLNAVFNDENNATGSGALTLVLSRCKAHRMPFGGKHTDYGEATLHFRARWALISGAYVNPLGITEAS